MWKRLVTLMLVACLFAGNTGCALVTKGDSQWEVYCGIRTEQKSEEAGSVGIESSVLEKLIESFTDGETTEAE
jgi:hypothetical protein